MIRGRVTGPDSLPVIGARVTATSYAGAVSKTAATDKNGRFTIIFINGESDYWITIAKLGFAEKRFEVKKVGEEEVIVANAKLASTIATLDAVNVVDQKTRALPNRNATNDVSGGDRPLTNGLLPPDQAGNLAAMAATIPGIQLIPGLDGAPDMFSILGLSGDQNNVTFNGLGSSVNILPPDALIHTSISPYSFDPSVGGFSGAGINISTIPGSNFSRRAMSNADITPPGEWGDPTADAQGQKYTSLRLGGNAAGPLSMDRAFYNASYNFSRRFADMQSLINTNPLGLAAAGVAADSVNRLLTILGNQHVPTLTPNVPSTQLQDLAQLALNADYMPSSSGTGNSFTLGGVGNYSRNTPAAGRSTLLLTTPAHAGESNSWVANIVLLHTNYFWFGVLSRTTLGLGGSGTSTDPYLQLPQGSVLVNSQLPDGSASVKSLSFGGSPVTTSGNNQTLQITNSLSWYSEDNRHTIKLTSGVTRDAFTSNVGSNLQGSFTFNSLADLEAGAPSAFTRTRSSQVQSGSQLVGVASLGDYWRPTMNVQVQYGLHVDANDFLSAPAFNQAVLDTFHLRNDVVPNRVYLSPRLGVQWYYGETPEVSYAPGAARPPRAVVHAGIGLFQNMAQARLISPAVNSTGLPASTQSLTCIGAAVPFPNWSGFLADPSSIPTACINGSAGTVFANSAPSVTLFDPQFRQPQSVRSAADWSSPILDNRFVLGLQAVVSGGLNQPGLMDINFNPTTRFTLSNEDGRPIFADSSAIVPATGSVATSASRLSPTFQRVSMEQSNLRVDSKLLTVDLKPVTANRYLNWDLTYAFLDARERYNGFTSTTGNPLETAWAPIQQGGRHTVQASWTDFPFFDIVFVTAGARFSSGPRFTPMIAADVNGDGFANDRAFIFNPATTTDTAVATAMRSLLANGTASARACLESQLGQLAGRASCQAPWTSQAFLSIKFNPVKIGLPKRMSIVFSVQNPLAIADLALHGGDDLRGWGQTIPPDQNLLFVRGFNPVTKQFIYDVNQRFGSTRPLQSATRVLPYISLNIGLDIGLPRERQLLTHQLDLGRGREGMKQSASSIKSLGSSSIPNPMSMILTQQDSLHLTRVQADSLAWLSRQFSVFADSIWTPVSNELAALPDNYGHGEAYDRYVHAREKTVDYLLTMVPNVKSILTASQRRKLPPQISNYLDERVLRFLRSSTAGDASSFLLH